MNRTEIEMVEVLRKLRDEFGVVSVKAEFEAEGTRNDELLRLFDIGSQSGLPLTLKIGGCEAIRDLFEAKQFGSRYVVAPMVESAYALSKYLGAIDVAFDEEDRKHTDFLFNIETKSGLEALVEFEGVVKSTDTLSGIVFGRVDFLGSLGLGKSEVSLPEVTDSALKVASFAGQCGLDLVVGGGVSADSIDSLRAIRATRLTRFETRKVVFAGESVELLNIDSGLLLAVKFELLWLQNKRNYYNRLALEDNTRLQMLEKRWARLLGDR